MRKYGLLISVVMLLLLMATSGLATESGSKVHKRLSTASAELRDFYAGQAELPEGHRHPRTDMIYRVTTYVGEECVLPHKVIRESSPIVRVAWDFDADGFIDWESEQVEQTRHVFEKAGQQYAVFYVFDMYGQYGMAEIRVDVLEGSGQPKVEPHRIELDLEALDKKRGQTAVTVFPDPEKKYFMLLADNDNWLWTPVVEAYHRLVDSLLISDEDIIVVAGGETGCGCGWTSYLEDTVIIDYPYTSDGVSEAFNYLLLNMTANDDLHIVSSAHGGGFADSTMAILDPNYMDHRPYEMVGGRLFTDKDDPDNVVTEQDFKLAIGGWWNSGYLNNSVGLDEWSANMDTSGYYQHAYRVKRVVSYHGMKFVGGGPRNDTDMYIEIIKQYLAGDKDRSGFIHPARNEVWDFDGDGIPPITVENGQYVFDEDDWGAYELVLNNDDNNWEPGTVYFDEGSDGTTDVCYDCGQFFPVPYAHATDYDDDGVLDRVDVNHDLDWDDSVGIDETAFRGYDDDVADFLDNLEYRYVTVTMTNCFSGGFIDDLSRPNVLIATATVEGTVAWGTTFQKTITNSLTGGVSEQEPVFEPANDRVVTYLEAYHELLNRGWTYGGRHRLDDNGDEVGHVYPLPNEGDGYMAQEMSWGTLQPPYFPPTPVSPDGDTLWEDITPTFIWSDSSDADSFQVEVQTCPCTLFTADTVLTLSDSCRLTEIPSAPHWRVKSFKGGRETGWSDWAGYILHCDYDCCSGIRGNVDNDPDDLITPMDLLMLVDFVYYRGDQPECFREANVDGLGPDGDNVINQMPSVLDALYLQEYLFNGGPPPVSCALCGDIDNSGQVDILDLDYFIDWFYRGGPEPPVMEAADVDCYPRVDIQDLQYLQAYIIGGGPPPCDCEQE